MNRRIYNSGARATKNAHKRYCKNFKTLQKTTNEHLSPSCASRTATHIILYERGERPATIAAMPGHSECTV